MNLSKLRDTKFFTTLDLGSAFWQVTLRKQERDKTGFACELELFQWTATFQRKSTDKRNKEIRQFGCVQRR